MRTILLLLTTVAACKSDVSTPDAPTVAGPDAPVGAPDAAPPDADLTAPDAEPQAVVSVACPPSPAAVVTTGAGTYVPVATNINVGDIVRFSPSGAHNVDADDDAFAVGFGATACFRFDEAALYTFRCTPHQFVGTITVAP